MASVAARSTVGPSGPEPIGRSPSGQRLEVEAVRALVRALRVLERASGELSLAHYRVLAAVASGDERASRVASGLALGKPAVSAAVDVLEDRGLLTRSKGEQDQRVGVLRLTAEGEAALARVEAAMIDRLTGLCARTPDGEEVLRSLAWLGAAVDQARAERQADLSGSSGSRAAASRRSGNCAW